MANRITLACCCFLPFYSIPFAVRNHLHDKAEPVCAALIVVFELNSCFQFRIMLHGYGNIIMIMYIAIILLYMNANAHFWLCPLSCYDNNNICICGWWHDVGVHIYKIGISNVYTDMSMSSNVCLSIHTNTRSVWSSQTIEIHYSITLMEYPERKPQISMCCRINIYTYYTYIHSFILVFTFMQYALHIL